MSVRNLINSPDFKNIQLAIELNMHSNEIRGLRDFCIKHRGKYMNFYHFTDKFSRLQMLEKFSFDVNFEDYGDFEMFYERLMEIIGIKYYYGGISNKNIVCSGWDTMTRLKKGIPLYKWLKRIKIEYYKGGMPF